MNAKIRTNGISIRTFDGNGKPQIEQARSPFPFIHEGVVFFAHRYRGGWRVSEMRTGHYIAASIAGTRKAAIAQARGAFDELGVARAKRKIKETLNKFGQVNFQMKRTFVK